MSWFPSMYEYVLDHRCPICKAAPGVECDAPYKEHHDPVNRQHAARIDRGIRHSHRDIGRAPWPEERVPGRQYGTLKHRKAEEAKK